MPPSCSSSSSWLRSPCTPHQANRSYHHRVLPRTSGSNEIAAAHARAEKSKTYDSVLYFSGRKHRGYGMENPMVYFAELSDAFYGTNDMYPFVRIEVKAHDPGGCKPLRKLWEEDTRRR